MSKFADRGPAYKHVATAVAHAKLKGINMDDLGSALSIQAILVDHPNFTLDEAIEMNWSLKAFEMKILKGLARKEAMANGEDMDEFERVAAPAPWEVEALKRQPLLGD